MDHMIETIVPKKLRFPPPGGHEGRKWLKTEKEHRRLYTALIILSDRLAGETGSMMGETTR